jgi:FtsP/CotA-like multicopper oxidase with cupredoxin domain
VQRWRLIDGAFRASIFFQVEGHALNEIALDGIYTGRVDTWNNQPVQLQPGYRSDVLIQAHRRPGSTAQADTFQIVDASSPAALSVRGVVEPQNLLAILVVKGTPVNMTLPTSAEMAPLNPFPGVQLKQAANQVQEVSFKLGSGLQPTESRNYFQVNFSAFNDNHRRFVKLNDTDMWSITTVGDSSAGFTGIPPLPHVFHIHVNPFQVARLGPAADTQIVWKDTQFIPPGDTLNLYTRYTRYTGAFVMHCHILDHEDLGMMEVVEVVDRLPQGTTGGHGHGGAMMMHGTGAEPAPAAEPAPGSGATSGSGTSGSGTSGSGTSGSGTSGGGAPGGAAPAADGGGQPHGGR